MDIINYFTTSDKEYWLAKIGKCDWGAGKYLCELIRNDAFFDIVGQNSRLLLLVDGDELISFCTLAEKDDIQPTELTPWMGFVYTFPEYRGHRYIGKLFEEIGNILKAEGSSKLYISTDHEGLYEKYGCTFMTEAKALSGDNSRIYEKEY